MSASQFAGRWPFKRGDAFADLDRRHHARVIHSLPGILIWPAMMFVFHAVITGATLSLAMNLDPAAPLGTARMAAAAGSYLVLGVIFFTWLSSHDLAGRVFSMTPRSGAEIGVALIAFLATFQLGPPLSNWFYEFAMLPTGEPTSLAERTNIDDIRNAAAATWVTVLAVVILAPIVEEAIFRGWMLPMMVARGTPWFFAILISSVGFGLAHLHQGLQVFAYTTVLGVCLGFARLVTGRTAAPVMAHILNNVWALYLFPWMFRNL